MSIKPLKDILFCCLLVASFSGFLPLRSSKVPDVEIIVERVERVSRAEADLMVKLINRSDRPVFLAGIKYESGPVPDFLMVEQWRLQGGWKTPACTDTAPPDVIKLGPGEVFTTALRWKLPMSVICRNLITRFEGKFRMRLEYFDSEEQARSYVEKLFSRHWREARATVAFSDPFKIPPALNSNHERR